MKKKLNILIIIIVGLLTLSCVEEFNPVDIGQNPEILVVDGIITNNETVINLSRSIGLNANFGPNDPVSLASVYIETGNGTLSQKANTPLRGTYVFSKVVLHPDSLYRLRIELDDDVYVSEFLTPMQTPEIDSIIWEKPDDGEPVSFYVNTSDNNDKSRFYRWTFNEIWEFTAPLYASGTFKFDSIYEDQILKIDTTIILYDMVNGPFNNHYYCWQSRSSSQHIVESTAHLSDNIIRYKKIHEAPSSSNRFSILYYFQVNQYQIRKSAYDYFENQQKNVESMGSIFAPIPSEMNGNITCLTRDVPVIGYVDVVTNTSKHIYITADHNLYEPRPRDCEIFPKWEYGLLPHYLDPQTGFDFAPADCVDCLKAGGNKNKPTFWPNNHF